MSLAAANSKGNVDIEVTSYKTEDPMKSILKFAFVSLSLLAASAMAAPADSDRDSSPGASTDASSSDRSVSNQADTDRSKADRSVSERSNADRSNPHRSRASAQSSEASSKRDTDTAMNKTDKTFVAKAAEAGLAEVELGQLAAERGQSDAVKNFGEHMVKDHSDANSKLKSIAEEKELSLPETLAKEHQNAVAQLKKLSGDKFDKAFMTQMVADHKKAVSLFRDQAKKGKDEDLTNLAKNTLPTLEEHLNKAQDIKKSL
jgi:putative membrane protein